MQVVSSITITPPEPAIVPAADQRVEVHADVDLVRREHLRGDSAGDDGLELPAAAHALRVASR